MSEPRTLHVNVYKGGWLGAHWTRDFADSAALSIGAPREACVEASFVDGQGLEAVQDLHGFAKPGVSETVEVPVEPTEAMCRAAGDLWQFHLDNHYGPPLSTAIWAAMIAASPITPLAEPVQPDPAVPATDVAATPAEGPVASPESERKVSPVDDELAAMIAAACARFNALTPEQQKAELQAQQESWVRGEMGMREADGRRTGRPANNDHEDDCA